MRVRALIAIAWELATTARLHKCERCADLEARLERAEQLAESRRLLLTVFDKNARRIESGKPN